MSAWPPTRPNVIYGKRLQPQPRHVGAESTMGGIPWERLAFEH
jgi:hypothetical protein